jgi:hypothetical protein
LGQSVFVLQQMISFDPGHGGWARWHSWFVIVVAVLAFAEERWPWFGRLAEGPARMWSAAVAVLLSCSEVLGVSEQAVPFVYFQF